MPGTKLLIGEEVFQLLDNPDFVKNWETLASQSPGFTALQEPGFVQLWYPLYRAEYEPVLSVLFGKENEPLAMMCLAWEKQAKAITHAGHNNAEYHGWLAQPGLEAAFVSDTIRLVRQRFGLKKWTWRWLPPGVDQEAFSKVDKADAHIGMEHRPALVWNLKEPEKLQKLKKSRSLKSKFKRLQKRGNFRFKVVTSEQETLEILQTAQHQTDFRQEAINNSRPFGDNPHKIAFYAARQRYPGTVHMSGLWLDDQLLAFHFGLIDGKRVCLGTSSYDPTESRLSPGTLLLVELAKALTEEGFEMLDLTPGTDLYKQRFANGEQMMVRPTICFSRLDKYRNMAKQAILTLTVKVLSVFKAELATLVTWKNNFEEGLERLKRTTLKDCLGCFLQKKSIRLYAFQPPPKAEQQEGDDDPIAFQRYQDLMQYRAKQPYPARRMLLQEAITKFSNGESLFSATGAGKLHWAAWLTEPQDEITPRFFPKPVQLPQHGRVLYDFYCQAGQFFPEWVGKQLAQLPPGGNEPIYLCLGGAKHIPAEKARQFGLVLENKITCWQVFHFFKIVR